MGVLRLTYPALLTAASLGCTAPGNAHPAQRCGVSDECPTGLVCHAGFCIDPTLDGQATADDFGVDGGNGAAQPDQPEASDPPAEGNDEGSGTQAPTPPPQTDQQEPTAPSGHDVSPGQAPQSCPWGPCCGLGLTLCGDACVNVLTALSHCGKCALACEPGFLCLGGQCCGEGELLCDGECVNPQKDKHHCGACGHECEHGPCKDGMCREDP